MSIRDELKAKSATLTRTKEFEAGGQELMAMGLMTGERNRLLEESRKSSGDPNIAKMNPRLIAMCIRSRSGEVVWNVNDLNDLAEIDGLDPEITEPMTQAANFVNGWGEDAVKAGKENSKAPKTSSNSSSPPASAAA
jgi:hypothetical protein